MTRNQIFLSLLFLQTQNTSAETGDGNEPENISAYAGAGWSSRYISQGIDNLDGGDIQTTVFGFSYSFFQLDVWNAWGYDSEYVELNVTPSLQFSWETIDFYVSYNRLEFFETDEHDDEIGFGFNYGDLPFDLSVSADWYHSFAADGSFIDVYLQREYTPTENLTLLPAVATGINNGFIANGHDGLNYVELLLQAEYELQGQFSLLGLVGYNFAIDSDPVEHPDDELLRDFFRGSVSVQFEF